MSWQVTVGAIITVELPGKPNPGAGWSNSLPGGSFLFQWKQQEEWGGTASSTSQDSPIRCPIFLYHPEVTVTPFLPTDKTDSCRPGRLFGAAGDDVCWQKESSLGSKLIFLCPVSIINVVASSY